MSAAELLPELLRGVERFARARLDARAADEAARLGPGVLEGLAELGLFGLSIPEAYGGVGLSLAANAELIAALAAHDRSVATTLGLHLGLGSRGLVAYGSSALKERYLPSLASGEAIAAFCATESGAGSDLSAIRTTLAAEGARLTLSGEKIFVTNAHLARVFTVAAASPGLGGAKKGHSLVLVERGDRGVSLGREEHKLGLRASSTASLYLDEVELDASRLIGEPGLGMRQLHHCLAWGRTLMAAGAAGAARRALELAVRHAESRRQFGRPLAALPVVREQLADMAATRFAADALVRRAATAEHDEGALERCSIAAKVFASEAAFALADRAVQLYGGSGFIAENEPPLLLRDTRISRIFEGANDVLRGHLGALVLGGAPIVGPLAPRVEAERAELRDRLGLRALREPILLHRLGSLSVLAAAAESASEIGGSLAERFVAMADHEAAALLGARAVNTGAICAGLGLPP